MEHTHHTKKEHEEWMRTSDGKMKVRHKLSSGKAKEILKHGEVRGHALTGKQKRFMGFVAGGGKPKKARG